MLRKVIIGCVLSSSVIINTNASADNHTVSLGYAQSKIPSLKDIRGVNAQYRYEWDSPVSVISSLTYMKGDEKHSHQDDYEQYSVKVDSKYYSLLAGPAYRINDYVSLYALVGVAHVNIEFKENSLIDFTQSSEEEKKSTTSVAYGAGIAINPTENMSVNIGYEGTTVKYDDNVSINGLNIGIGYRF